MLEPVVHAPQPRGHDPHDLEREVGALLHERLEALRGHRCQGAGGERRGRRAAGCGVDEGHFPEHAALAHPFERAAGDREADRSLEDHVHMAAILAFDEDGLPGRERLRVAGVAEEGERRHRVPVSRVARARRGGFRRSAGFPFPRRSAPVTAR